LKKKEELIYVAGPLNASSAVQYIKNVAKMIRVAVALRKKGYYPYVPCLDFLIGLVAGNWEYEDFAGLNFPYVDVCGSLFFIAHSLASLI